MRRVGELDVLIVSDGMLTLPSEMLAHTADAQVLVDLSNSLSFDDQAVMESSRPNISWHHHVFFLNHPSACKTLGA